MSQKQIAAVVLEFPLDSIQTMIRHLESSEALNALEPVEQELLDALREMLPLAQEIHNAKNY